MFLPEFRLEAYFGVWEFKARYHLTASDAQTLPLADLIAMADGEDRRRWEELRLSYIPTEGTAELRSAIAQTYDRIEPDDVLSFTGAEEGLYCAMQALLGPGDHAVVLVPNYQSMESVPRSICADHRRCSRSANGMESEDRGRARGTASEHESSSRLTFRTTQPEKSSTKTSSRR